ncbi:zinc finger protein 271 [Zeugodacus cucurbitae]|uniref:Zinc finger protein 700 n=1 Tax=Zeugodacus cucurbitae TaxID=28588 RepID=A0A0A1WZK7_ZEUCU|nr:zinc finger protein 271 [Zeugodacus cucurbitae]
MSLLTKENAYQHCRTCLKRLGVTADISSGKYVEDAAPDNKDLQFNISNDAELQQLIYIYIDGPSKNDTVFAVDNELPDNICLACYDKLHNFSLFCKRAQQSAEKLRTVLNCSSGMIKVEINYDEDENEQHKESTDHLVQDSKLQFRDALMEDEQVFFETSVANMANTDLSDEIADPFAPSLQATSECSSKEIVVEKPDDVKREAPVLEKEKYKCTQCTQTYAFNSELDVHIRQMHNVNKLPFSCGHCDKAYRYIRSLQEHMKQKHQAVLSANAQFKCSVCPKAFLTDLSLKKHMCFHIKEDMARVCGICSKRFPVKNLLVEHLRTHSTDGRIPCSQCEKSFMWYQDLLNHERSAHLKEKPFPCKLCDKSFQTQKSLRFHSYRHSGEKPYLCDVCGKDFRQPTAMKQHRLKHFKNDTIEKS